MRKPAFHPPRKCELCGVEYTPRGFVQRFCPTCGAERDKQRKRLFYEKTHPDRKPKQKSTEVCTVCGKPFSSHFNGLPYCNTHYLRMYLNGSPDLKGRKRTNTYKTIGDITEVTTSSGRKFIIDTADLETVSKHSWCFDKRSLGYLVANINHKVVSLHRYLLNPPKGMVVDHINGDTSDNRRSNLRICTQKENARNCRVSYNNRFGHLGIAQTKSGKYRVQITVDRHTINCGLFDDFDEAVRVRHVAEECYFGDFSQHKSRTQISTPAVLE